MRANAVALWRLLHPLRGRLLAGLALSALSALAGVLPFIAVAGLARVLLSTPVDAGLAWRLVAVAIGAMLLRLLSMGLALHLGHRLDSELQWRLRRQLAAHLGRLPLAGTAGRDAADTGRIVQDDVHTLHQAVAHAPHDLAAALIAPLACLLYLLVIDWRLAGLALLLPALAAWRYRALRSTAFRVDGQALQAAQARVSAATIEFVQGIAFFRAYGLHGRAQRRFLAASDAFSAFFLRWVRRWSGVGASVDALLSPLPVLALTLAGGIGLQLAGQLQAADLVPFALLVLALTAPVAALGHGGDALARALAAAGRLVAVLDTPPLPQSSLPRRPEDARVVFEHVSVTNGQGGTVLHDIDLTLEPGTLTALVGASGAGKSTLLSLLPRFRDPSRGVIRIGGVDLREIGSDALCRQVALVFQQAQLLRLSVADNIRLSCPDADQADVEAAARLAGIHDRITCLPDGYQTRCGEGVTLSGGETQRLAIARALLQDAPVLLLDEATSALDPISEEAVQQALSTLAAGRTVLTVAHRLNTIATADQIIVLAHGRVIERGCHAALLAHGGEYARMWALQNPEQEVMT